MSETLNGWLERGNMTRTRPCDEWNVTELHQLQALLYLARDSSLDKIYQVPAPSPLLSLASPPRTTPFNLTPCVSTRAHPRLRTRGTTAG